MRVDFRRFNDAVVAEPQDERLDVSSAAGFKGQMVDAINNGSLRLVLNLSKVQFIDSSGLTAIISTIKTLGPEGKLVVCGLNHHTRNLFKLTRLDRIIGVFNGEEEALKSL